MRPDNPNRLAPTVQRDYNYAYFPVLNRFTALRIKPYYKTSDQEAPRVDISIGFFFCSFCLDGFGFLRSTCIHVHCMLGHFRKRFGDFRHDVQT